MIYMCVQGWVWVVVVMMYMCVQGWGCGGTCCTHVCKDGGVPEWVHDVYVCARVGVGGVHDVHTCARMGVCKCGYMMYMCVCKSGGGGTCMYVCKDGGGKVT